MGSSADGTIWAISEIYSRSFRIPQHTWHSGWASTHNDVHAGSQAQKQLKRLADGVSGHCHYMK